MSRVEENRKLGERRYNGNHETLLNAILYDISKSLAVLADSTGYLPPEEVFKRYVPPEDIVKRITEYEKWNVLNAEDDGK